MSRFRAKIQIINGNPYVRPPDRTLKAVFDVAKRDKGPIPVRGKLNSAGFQQSLVRYSGDWRLYINGNMAKAAGLKYSGSIAAIVGRVVEVDMEFDPAPPLYKIPAKLEVALDGDKIAKSAFERLSPGRKKEIFRYLGFLKTDGSVDRNIQRILQHLRGEDSDALYPLMHRKQRSHK